MSLPDWKRFAESEAFNWRCMICSVLAQSPRFLEDQWLVEYGLLKDYDGVTLWVKCSECCTPYYLNCLPNPSEIPPGKVHLYFHGVQEVIFCCTCTLVSLEVQEVIFCCTCTLVLDLYALFLSLAIIVIFYFFFSLSMAGHGNSNG